MIILILYCLFVGLGLLVNYQWSRMNRKYDKEVEMELTRRKNRHTLIK